MAMTRQEKKDILERAHKDPVFRVALLKMLLNLALEADHELLAKALDKLEPKKK